MTDPTNKNIPKMINENINIGKLVFSASSAKNPFGICFLGVVKSYPHCVQNSTSSPSISFPQFGQNFGLTI